MLIIHKFPSQGATLCNVLIAITIGAVDYQLDLLINSFMEQTCL